jgi:hypothetical protein
VSVNRQGMPDRFGIVPTDPWRPKVSVARGTGSRRGAPGDTETARTLLTKPHATAGEHGYEYVERRAAAALLELD